MSVLPRLEEWKAKLDAQRAARAEALRTALTTAQGNVTRAAAILAISRQRVTVLVKELGLNDFARELRRGSGYRGVTATGRPRSLKNEK